MAHFSRFANGFSVHITVRNFPIKTLPGIAAGNAAADFCAFQETDEAFCGPFVSAEPVENSEIRAVVRGQWRWR
jgi:hypothetical protein